MYCWSVNHLPYGTCLDHSSAPIPPLPPVQPSDIRPIEEESVHLFCHACVECVTVVQWFHLTESILPKSVSLRSYQMLDSYKILHWEFQSHSALHVRKSCAVRTCTLCVLDLTSRCLTPAGEVALSLLFLQAGCHMTHTRWFKQTG